MLYALSIICRKMKWYYSQVYFLSLDHCDQIILRLSDNNLLATVYFLLFLRISQLDEMLFPVRSIGIRFDGYVPTNSVVYSACPVYTGHSFVPREVWVLTQPGPGTLIVCIFVRGIVRSNPIRYIFILWY